MKQKKLSLGQILRKISEGEQKSDTGSPEAPVQRPDIAVEPGPVSANPVVPAGPSSEPRKKPPSPYSRNGQTPEPPARQTMSASPATGENPGETARAADLTSSRKAEGGQETRHHSHGHEQPAPPRQPPPQDLTPKEGDEEEVEFDLWRYLGIIIHRKNIVLAATCIVTLFSIFQYLKSEKSYTSHARLLFKPAEKEMTGEVVSSSVYNRDKLFNTHLELLKSNTVLTIVTDNLGNRVTPARIKRDLTIAQGVTNKDKNDIIELTYKNSDPELARDVINEICKTYIDYRLEVNAQEVTRLLYKFDVQISKLQQELDQKEGDLRRFKESNRMVELSNEASLTTTKLSSMEISLQETQLALIESRDKLSSLTSQIGKQDLDIVQSMTYSDPIKNKLAALELEYNSLSAENSPEHYMVKKIKQQIDKLKSAAADSISQEAESKTLVKNPLRQSLLTDYVNLTIEQSALEAKRIALEKVIEGLNADLLKLPAIEQKYAFLQRETEAILQTLRLLKTKYEEAKIKRDSQETDIKILELAELPRTATSGKKPVSILIGLMIGLILGVALAFLLEYLDQSVKNPLQIEKVLGMPLLGVVPLIETSDAIIKKTDDLKKTILEPFRTLRANIKHLASTYDHKVFMICSAIKGEGKTTLAANLAITFALDNKKVIIVDADLRRSQLHTLFSIPKETGLADYLLEAKSIDDVIKPTIYENLRIITSGERPHNPAELIGTMRFDVLIQQLKKRADIVIFDSPALLPVSDGLSMAPKMDGCIMAFRTMWTPLKAAKQAKEQITRVGAHILGGIFNGVSQGRGYYPYYYGYYGYYSYTKYSYEDEPKKKFDWRETGIIIEELLKKGLRSFRDSLPHLIAGAGSFTKNLAKKKTFWVLAALLLGLTGIELWLNLQPAPTGGDEEGIVYLGVGGAGNGEERGPGAGDRGQGTGDRSPMPMEDTSGKVPTQGAASQKISDTIRNNVPGPSLAATGLRDSIARWFAAKKRGDIPALLRFYDSLEFKGVGNGGFNELRGAAAKSVLRDTAAMVIDSIWQGADRWPLMETKARLRMTNGIDTTRIIVAHLWKSNAAGSWRIVGEKK
jgi:polysaccharide biosynthesis transport protein